MPSGGSFVHVPCLSKLEPAIQEGGIQSPQSNSVKAKSGEKSDQAEMQEP